MWIERDIATHLRGLARTRPVVVVTGARQTGKTSLLEREFPSHGRVSLDVPLMAAQAEEAGEAFLDDHPAPLIIDEVQYAPGVLRHVKLHVDAARRHYGQYLITGSQKFALMQGVSESLAGRAAILELHPLSLAELERWAGRRTTRQQLLEWMFQGSYPELHAAGLEPERYYADYLATYLERDVRQVLEVRNLRDFDRFLRLVATRTGQVFSAHALASDLGISPNTAKSWLSVLEASNVIVMIEPYYRNLGKRVVKTPKLYFLDTGLACYLCGLRSARELARSQHLGAFFETLVLGQMVRWFTNRGKRPNVYFYRDHQGHEVDFVVPVGEKLKLFECKWTARPGISHPGFAVVERAAGEEAILSRTLVTPERGRVKLHDVTIEDCVELESLEE